MSMFPQLQPFLQWHVSCVLYISSGPVVSWRGLRTPLKHHLTSALPVPLCCSVLAALLA